MIGKTVQELKTWQQENHSNSDSCLDSDQLDEDENATKLTTRLDTSIFETMNAIRNKDDGKRRDDDQAPCIGDWLDEYGDRGKYDRRGRSLLAGTAGRALEHKRVYEDCGRGYNDCWLNFRIWLLLVLTNAFDRYNICCC